jgi:hypothetical protein
VSHNVHAKKGGLVHPQGQNTGRWGSSIIPSGRSSLMKYLNKKSNGNMLYYYHPLDSKARIKSQLEIEFIPEDNSLDSMVCLPLVLKCLSLTVGIFPFEDAHESMLPSSIMPSLNIHIDGPGFLSHLHVNLHTVLLGGL